MTEKRYLLLVQVAYSLEIMRPLQAAIRARGHKAAWYLHGVDKALLNDDEVHLATVDEVREWQPLAVFVPGNWVPFFFPGVKVEIFHGLANDDTGKKGHYRIRGLFDLYCTHAPEGTSRFSQLARKHGHFAVIETGWPKLDPFYQQVQPGPREPTPDDPRPVILFGSTFSPSLTCAPQLADTIERLSNTGKWRWLITLHPKTKPHILQRYKAMEGPHLTFVDSTEGVINLIQRADVMVCDTSSIMLEFMLMDRPVVTFKTRVPGPHVHNIMKPEDLEGAIEHALERPDAQLRAARMLMQSLHAYTDGHSSERILDAVDTFIANIQSNLKPKPLNPWRRWQMRRRLGYWKR